METVGILYICTGAYDVFWDDFYKTCEEHFVGVEKKYFVFTDSEKILNSKNKYRNMVATYQENLGWPGNTLFRFRIFNAHEDLYEGVDYLYFFNANFIFVEDVGRELLPEGDELVCVRHPGYFNKKSWQLPYCRNIRSKAFIPYFFGKVYVMGGLNGGKKETFLKVSKELERRTDIDYEKGVIATWHDESQINRYVLENGCKLMDSSYGYPEGWNIPFKAKLILRDKSKWVDVNNIKKG